MSSLVITVDSTPDNIMSAAPGATNLGITAYSEPALLAMTNYAPSSPYMHGAVALSWNFQQALLNWTVAPFLAADETEANTLVETLRADVSRLRFNTTVALNGVSKVWLCDAGSVTPANPRSRIDLDRPWITEWNVSIPCYPVAG